MQINPNGIVWDSAPAPQRQPTMIAPAKPPEPKTTYGLISPKEAAALRLPPGTYQRSSEGNITKIADAPKPGANVDARQAMLELRNVMDAAFRARELSKKGWFSTGFGANLAKGIGGTPASAVDGKLDVIGANTAFEKLQQMREASPTGGALGQVTERELDLLKSTIASLKQGQPDEEFQGSMQAIANAYGRVLMKMPGGRQMMIERGWLPKAGNPKAGKKKPSSGWSIEEVR